MKKRIRIIGVPVDLGAGRRGVDMGPSALRVAGIDPRVAALGHDVEDLGDLTVTIPETVSCGRSDLRFIDAVLSVNRALADAVRSILADGGLPLILGGDHSIAIGSVAGSASFFAKSSRSSAAHAPAPAFAGEEARPGAPAQSKIQNPECKIAARAAHRPGSLLSGDAAASGGQPLGVIWLDAHADMNTPQTTPTGNIHGMCLAVLLGLGDDRLVDVGRVSNPSVDDGFPNPSTPGAQRASGPSSPRARIAARHVALVGVRDIDSGERDHLRATGVRVFTMREIDERGMAAVMTDAIRVASDGTAGIHLQLDMDALDPEFAPGTGTPVPGGLSYREAHLAMEMLADAGNLVAMDVVEINPIMGQQNQTAELAVELVLSALGKRIL